MITFYDDTFTLFTLDEVVAETGIPITRVRQLLRDGQLVSVWHGGTRMVSMAEVSRFLDAYVPPEPRPRLTTAGTTRRFIPPPRPAA